MVRDSVVGPGPSNPLPSLFELGNIPPLYEESFDCQGDAQKLLKGIVLRIGTDGPARNQYPCSHISVSAVDAKAIVPVLQR